MEIIGALPTQSPMDIGTELSDNKELDKQNRLRKRVIDELITTEKTYVNGLETLFKVFVDPLKNTSDTEMGTFVSYEDHCVIFPSDLITIYTLHTQLSADLIQSTKKWDPDTSKIGHVFIKYGDLFKMYNIYFFKHEKAVQRLTQLKEKNRKFAKWCQDQCRNMNGMQLNIESLLILPVQRLPRYSLLLREIIKRTDKYHPDLYHLQEALEQIGEITELINDQMKENDRRMKVAMVEKRFIDLVDSIGFFVKPSRMFIAESSNIIRHDQYGGRIPITLFLFNDCLIYGYYEESYSYGYGYGDANLRFGSILVFDSLFRIEDVDISESNNNLYHDIHSLKIRSRHHAIWISFDSHKAKSKWSALIGKQNAIQQTLITNKSPINKEKNELCLPRPVFVPDDFSVDCMDCKAKFSILLRRHHCYLCGKLCCDECTRFRSVDVWKLYFEDKEEYVRICAMCHEDTQSDDEVELTESNSDSDVVDDQKCPATTFDITKNHLMSSTRVSKRREKMKQCLQKSSEQTNHVDI
eukprot:427812_1